MSDGEQSEYTEAEESTIPGPSWDCEWDGVFTKVGYDFFFSPHSNPEEKKVIEEELYLKHIQRQRMQNGQLHLFQERRMLHLRNRKSKKSSSSLHVPEEMKILPKLSSQTEVRDDTSDAQKSDTEDDSNDSDEDAGTNDLRARAKHQRRMYKTMEYYQKCNPKQFYERVDKNCKDVFKRVKDSIFLYELDSHLMAFKYHLPYAKECKSSNDVHALNIISPAASPEKAFRKPTTFKILKRVLRSSPCPIYLRHKEQILAKSLHYDKLLENASKLIPERRMKSQSQVSLNHDSDNMNITDSSAATTDKGDHIQKIDHVDDAPEKHDEFLSNIGYVEDVQPMLVLQFSDSYGRLVAHGAAQFHLLESRSEVDDKGNRITIITEPVNKKSNSMRPLSKHSHDHVSALVTHVQSLKLDQKLNVQQAIDNSSESKSESENPVNTVSSNGLVPRVFFPHFYSLQQFLCAKRTSRQY
jgi:hypothetical protein